jgi:hypothetical protein
VVTDLIGNHLELTTLVAVAVLGKTFLAHRQGVLAAAARVLQVAMLEERLELLVLQILAAAAVLGKALLGRELAVLAL